MALIREICQALPSMPSGYTLDDLAATVAEKVGFQKGPWRLKGAALVRKVRESLDQPEVIAGVRRAFELGANFGPVDAVRRLAQWINGEVEHDGKRLPPSLEALKSYFTMTMPRPPKQVQVDQRSLVTRFEVRSEAPPIRPRAIDVEPISVLDVPRETDE